MNSNYIELAYILFKDSNGAFKNINLGGRYRFRYIESEKKLEILKNDTYIESFFNISSINNIINVTGIIGENGSGKTKMLDKICRNIYYQGIKSDEEMNNFSAEIIIAFIKNNRLIIMAHESFIELESNIDADKEINREITIYGKNFKENIEKNKKVKNSNIMAEMVCIYFSNIFDSKMGGIITDKRKNYYNISINGLLGKIDKNKITLYGMAKPRGQNEDEYIRNNRYGTNQIKAFKLNQIEKQIQFNLDINKRRSNIELDFELPKEIAVLPQYIHGNPESYILRAYDEKIKKSRVEERIYEILNGEEDRQVIKRTMFIALFNVYFEEMERAIKGESLDFIDEQVGVDDILELMDIYYNKWNKIHENNKEEKLRIDKEYGELHKNYKGLINLIEQIIENNEIDIYVNERINNQRNSIGAMSIYNEKYGYFYLDITQNKNEIMELIEFLQCINTDQSILNITWRNMSSGEYAMLEIYSRLYNVFNEISGKSVLLLIDEGELYLHPEWQRKYIHGIIRFINNICKENKVQIIFTSNTPLVITDIPRNNLVMLEKYNNGSIKKNSVIGKTFAANINTLLVESFFMESSIGEFAKNKIEEVLKYLKQPNYKGVLNDTTTLKVIKMIGEDIIRKKLLQLYNEKNEKNEKARIVKSELKELLNSDIDNDEKDKLKKEIAKILEIENMLKE